MISVEATGKNIEQAINNALFELKASREDVDIKIIDEGGFFRKAKVVVSISPEEEEKYLRKEELKKEEEKQDLPLEEPGKMGNEMIDPDVDAKDDVDEEDTIADEVEQTAKPKTDAPDVDDFKKAKKFLDGFLAKTSLTGNVEMTENDDEIFANIVGYGDIIGYRGEGLNALQYLTNVVIQKNNRHAKKVRLDCDNYRKRREESLVALAQRMAKKVERTNSSVKLEPMTANERRIIHTALADSETVETFSKGEEPHRYLIIKPKQ